MSGAHSAGAYLVITEAVERFRDTMSTGDRTQIEGTKLDDVVDALISIQQDLQQRRENRNLRKLYPFVEGLRRYSGAIDTLSNGLSPYLPWIWAPIKLMLQITVDYLGAFDKLIDAYGRIAETMPRLKNLGDTFKDSPALLAKLALYYVDVLEFHRRAYKFVRRRSWPFFFKTTWANFDFRFNSILASMAKNSEAIDQEAVTIDIIEAKQWREMMALQVTAREKDRTDQRRQSVMSWLALDNLPQHDNRERLLRDCLQGSCDWVLRQEKVASWVKIDSRQSVVWLHGKPGAGKSVICASLIDSVDDVGITTLSYFCKHHQNDTLSNILKALVMQIIGMGPDFVTIAFTEFVEKHLEPSLKVLRAMLMGSPDKPGLLHGIPVCRIVIDGLDECDPREQKYIVEDLLKLVSVDNRVTNCKLMISSRDVPEISRAMQKKKRAAGVVALSNESDSMNNAIRTFIERRLGELSEERESLRIGNKLVEEIVRIMIDKADGMFLWARLVLDSLSDVDSLEELHATITSMPKELPQLYARILDALCPAGRDDRMDKVMRILAWLVFAKRPLKRHELLHGVSVTPETPVLDEWHLLDGCAIDRCKPLVEDLPDGSVALVHFTVEEYLRTNYSAQRLDAAVWEQAIAFTCVTVLKDSLCLLDPDLPRPDQLARILTGSHALLPYAIDFWLEHVLVYASDNYLSSECPLGRASGSLRVLHDSLHSRLIRITSKETTPSTQASVDRRLEKLAHLSVYSLCVSIVALRAKCADGSASDGKEFEELILERDPTLFSALSMRFSERVEELLSETFSSDEISKDELDRFRKQYAETSFRCRFAPCTRASLGFASEALRASHEQLHIKRLFCDKPNCARGRIGFRHQRDLEIHKRTYHEEGSILVPPRVRKASNTVEGGQYTLSYNGRAHSIEGRNLSAVLSRAHENIIKYQISLPFDTEKIEKALEAWREERMHQGRFAVLLNEKFKSGLNINLMWTFRHTSDVRCVDMSPDDSLIATGSHGMVRIFDIRTGKEKYCFSIATKNITGSGYVDDIRFSNDGRHVMTASGNEFLRWQLEDPNQGPTVLGRGQESYYNIAVARDDRTAVTCGDDNAVRVWDLWERRDETKPMLRKTISVTEFDPMDVAISPDSRLVVAGCGGHALCLWDARTGELLQRSICGDLAGSVSFSPDGRTLISGYMDGPIMIWKIDLDNPRGRQPLQPLKSLKLHRESVVRVLMTENGRWILSCSEDHSVIFWDAETGEPHLLLVGHKNSVYGLAVGRSSRIFATASTDGTCKVFSYST